jgi:hypothetical protein
MGTGKKTTHQGKNGGDGRHWNRFLRRRRAERFFRQIPGCRHLYFHSQNGIELLEMVCYDFVGLASEAELLAHLEKLKRQDAAKTRLRRVVSWPENDSQPGVFNLSLSRPIGLIPFLFPFLGE